MQIPRSRTAVRTTLTLLVLAAASVLLVGCGCSSCDEDDYYGNVYVDNQTHTSQGPAYVVFFEVARFGEPWTGDLLSADLPPGATEFVGTFDEDYYDAYAEDEFGDPVEWYDVFVGYGEDVFFEIF